jgi:hypothetical protein
MISYIEATAIVARGLADSWEPGTFYVDPEGFENNELFMVPYGAREWLVNEDDTFLVMDSPIALVNKETGELDLVVYLENQELIESLTTI